MDQVRHDRNRQIQAELLKRRVVSATAGLSLRALARTTAPMASRVSVLLSAAWMTPDHFLGGIHYTPSRTGGLFLRYIRDSRYVRHYPLVTPIFHTCFRNCAWAEGFMNSEHSETSGGSQL